MQVNILDIIRKTLYVWFWVKRCNKSEATIIIDLMIAMTL